MNRIKYLQDQTGESIEELSLRANVPVDVLEKAKEDISTISNAYLSRVNGLFDKFPIQPWEVKTARKKLGLTAKELSKKIGCSLGALRRFETHEKFCRSFEEIYEWYQTTDVNSSTYILLDYVAKGWVVSKSSIDKEQVVKWCLKLNPGPKQAVYKVPPGLRPPKEGTRLSLKDVERSNFEIIETSPARLE